MSRDIDITIKQIIDKYGLLDNRKKSKSLGQHFLCDESLLDKIVKCSFPVGDVDVVEVGPGPCGLTRSILKLHKNSKVFCIEKDVALKVVHDNLKESFQDRLFFIYDDALNVKAQDLTHKNIIIISNLPYNVGTAILLNWLKDLSRIDSMVLMFQKEVAERITAKVGTKQYGRLSVISQILCQTELVFNVSKEAFYPAPKVMSSIVKLTPKLNPEVDFEFMKKLEWLTNVSFQQRRKTIFSNLKSYINPEKLENILNTLGIDQKARPEVISPEMFFKFVKEL